jgi:hypothetical protein
MSLTTRCHAHHSMEQRLCRWLLQALDRAGSNELRITHELTRAVTELDRGILEARPANATPH